MLQEVSAKLHPPRGKWRRGDFPKDHKNLLVSDLRLHKCSLAHVIRASIYIFNITQNSRFLSRCIRPFLANTSSPHASLWRKVARPHGYINVPFNLAIWTTELYCRQIYEWKGEYSFFLRRQIEGELGSRHGQKFQKNCWAKENVPHPCWLVCRTNPKSSKINKTLLKVDQIKRHVIGTCKEEKYTWFSCNMKCCTTL